MISRRISIFLIIFTLVFSVTMYSAFTYKNYKKLIEVEGSDIIINAKILNKKGGEKYLIEGSFEDEPSISFKESNLKVESIPIYDEERKQVIAYCEIMYTTDKWYKLFKEKIFVNAIFILILFLFFSVIVIYFLKKKRCLIKGDVDFLTGLYNKKYLEQEKIKLDSIGSYPLSVAICDIDGLRMINNAYGYDEGDKLIIKTSELLKECFNRQYILSHIGGGEFIILLPLVDKCEMEQFKRYFKLTIKNYNMSITNNQHLLSVSMAYSSKDKPIEKIDDILKTAERHLSRRKLLKQNSYHSDIVSSIMATLYEKSQETEEHGQRLAKNCNIIGEKIGLAQNDLDDLQLFSKLHDIGKIGIDNKILNKAGKLNDEEWEIMKKHPKIGYRIAMATPQLKHIAEGLVFQEKSLK